MKETEVIRSILMLHITHGVTDMIKYFFYYFFTTANLFYIKIILIFIVYKNVFKS